MKRVVLILCIVLLGFALDLQSPQITAAATCASVNVTPESGDINTEFAMLATGCVVEDADQTQPSFLVRYTSPSGIESTLDPIRLAEPSGFSLVVSIGGFIETGVYQVQLVQIIQIGVEEKLIGSDSFTVEEGEEPPDDVIACGSICSLDNTCGLCPAWCPSGKVTREDGAVEYRCSNDNPALCGEDHVGINSAIGCIPFDDVNLTTQFFLRWALGVGGGIALFLIAVSGIKIMTVKDDPKRLQDARDTLSAAIAGIVLIILSVFLVRFLTETLLNLF
jgi:hypothetical protein